MKVYLAGPDVFLPDALEIGARKTELCARYGLTGLFPLDNKVDLSAPDAARQIFAANKRMMDRAGAIVANLTPFRGPSADAGTVYELGYMIGRGKRALGYCNDPAFYPDRVARMSSVSKQPNGVLIDEDGLTVEDFGGVDNLVITEALESNRAPLILSRQVGGDMLRDLAGFERCLQILSGRNLP